MGAAEDMKKVAEEIVSSYQSRISEVAAMVDSTRQILEDFKTRRNNMSNQLKEALAREGSLRRKDFDIMISGILFHQDEREKQVKELLNTFFEEQKEVAEVVRKSLTEGKRVRIDDFRKSLQNIQARQKSRELGIKTALIEFQEEYKEIVASLSSLLDEEEEMRIKDFKEMVSNIRVWQMKHAKETKNKLGGF
ncbi:MAG: hypothetical protein P9L90_02005 [Candidatus Aadella gelida]|nr:hypothetical protein [Candidatus Aadella gelida]